MTFLYKKIHFFARNFYSNVIIRNYEETKYQTFGVNQDIIYNIYI